ncbi:riboflavin kinase [Pseudarthrobacter sp. H3Y2-7]|uniref:riboflavin kinase n=1 Tax=Pseudarthrobacter naphthalenicus TaxID=3031328 RepID=UPI0023B04EBB|nr:riboflavin kinase [Pseudarthrobacter sp. H3Y2-7]MDE8671051.1 riboflavin kinase [Pseudarthrobacter sp. H3Y2-7]
MINTKTPRELAAVITSGATVTVVEGTVEHGDARGRLLGFPTANLILHNEQIQDGVWTAIVEIPSHGSVVAAVSIGRRSTFYTEGERLLEAHLLDFDQDIYGEHLQVKLFKNLRIQRSFASIVELTEQLKRDVEATRTWAAKHYPVFLAAKNGEPQRLHS